MVDKYRSGVIFYADLFEIAGDVWTDTPTHIGIFIYSVLTPIICLCGIVGNLMCLLVLNKKRFICSFYVYLRVISGVDLISCTVIFLSGLARGVFWWKDGWTFYDALIGNPLGGFLSNMSTIATVFITIDRLIYLKNPLRQCKPKFCSRKNAMKVMCFGIVISILFTLPFCFIYEYSEDDSLVHTSFYHSKLYAYYTWIDLNVFATIPLGFLLVGNILLICSIRKAHRMQRECELLKGRTRKIKDQTKLTITLIAIVFFYLIGEVPTHLTARKTAAHLLFGSDDSKADASVALEIARQVTTVLNALHLASKFILYCLFCPPFYRALKSTILGKPPQKKLVKPFEATNVPVKLFIVGSDIAKMNRGFNIDLNQLGFMNIFINTKTTQEFPRFI